MDKPIPINTNHKCFEGDALNNRGWCEIYSIKAEETNPHWYKCDIDVKYLTHNLNTRFKINRGIRVSKWDKAQLMAESFPSGNKIVDNEFFDVDTDGTFIYTTDEDVKYEFTDENGDTVTDLGDSTTYTYTDNNGVSHTVEGISNVVSTIQAQGWILETPVLNETLKVLDTIDIPNNQRNMFSIDNGQHINVKTHKPISEQSVITFEWLSSLMEADSENMVSRIIRLIDSKTKQPVFEYEYTDFEIDEDDVSCNVIARIFDGEEWLSDEEHINLRIDTQIYDIDDAEVDSDSETLYGSTVILTLDDNKVKVVDEGFSSLEYELEPKKISGEKYYWETEWINKNEHLESDDVLCYFDISVLDTILTSKYSKSYKKLFVSPFPVKDKKLIFTRNAEEGTIYYFEDDGEEASYLIDPYYQYMNGTDLVNKAGSSIFNLNYGYDIVYIQNGLVRLGFNRLNGKLYLGKYDTSSKQYINTHRFHLKKYDDINLNSISDDRIVIQASDSTFTIWRGHPYIKIKHNNESIFIDSRFNRVWGEQVGDDDPMDLPTYWDLMNDSNMFRATVGGSKTLNAEDMTVDTVEVGGREATTLSWVNHPSTTNTGVSTTYSVTGTVANKKESVPLDLYNGMFGFYRVSASVDHTIPKSISLIVPKNPIQVNEVANPQARVVDYDDVGIEDRDVYFYESWNSIAQLTSNKSTIQSGDSANLEATLFDADDGNRVKEEGKDVYFYIVDYED